MLFFILVLSLAASCAGSRTINNMPADGNGRVASVLQLHGDTTLCYMTDFFPGFDAVDSVSTVARGVSLLPGESGWDTFEVLLAPGGSPALFYLDVWHDGKKFHQSRPLNIVCQDRRAPGDVTQYIYTTGSAGHTVTFGFTGKPDRCYALWQNVVLPDVYVRLDGGSLRVTIPSAADDAGRSSIRIYASLGAVLFNDVTVPISDGVPVMEAADIPRNDPHGQVIYSLMVDRFLDGNPANTRKLNRPDVLPKVDYMGGDLAGVTQKIEDGYFDSLGINTIWLSPVVRNPDDAWGLNKDPFTRFSGYHGYWPVNPTVLDPRMGTPEELKKLLAEAHARGINVLLDYVSNHLHINSSVMKAHPDWVTPLDLPDGRKNLELWDEYRLTTWFDLHIPSLDLEREEVYEPMSDSALYWLEEYDFDGFRHDATKHIPEVYWRTLTRKMAGRFPGRDIYQIGETYGSPELISSYVRTGMLDAQFDFNVYDAFIWNAIPSDGSMANVAAAIGRSLSTYGYNNVMGYITGNHDRARFVSLAGGAVDLHEDSKKAGWKRQIGVGSDDGYRRLALLDAMIMTIPGVPCIYQGDEFGDPGANDPDNRRMMRFSGLTHREREQFDLTRRLVHLRRSSMPLIYGTYIPLHADKGTMVYARTYMGETMVVALNNSGSECTVDFALPAFLRNNYWKPLFGSDIPAAENGVMRITLKPVSFEIYSNH